MSLTSHSIVTPPADTATKTFTDSGNPPTDAVRTKMESKAALDHDPVEEEAKQKVSLQIEEDLKLREQNSQRIAQKYREVIYQEVPNPDQTRSSIAANREDEEEKAATEAVDKFGQMIKKTTSMMKEEDDVVKASSHSSAQKDEADVDTVAVLGPTIKVAPSPFRKIKTGNRNVPSRRGNKRVLTTDDLRGRHRDRKKPGEYSKDPQAVSRRLRR